MISVIIPTLNATATLAQTLGALVPAAVDGFVREVIVCDGGSTDATTRIADDAGVHLITAPAGRGSQLKAGAAVAKCPWLLFLHADTVLADDWTRHAFDFIRDVNEGRRKPSAAAFQFKLDDKGFKPRLLEQLVSARCHLLGLPYGDQGLLIPRTLYSEIGGFRELPIMEDVEIARRLGRRKIAFLNSPAVTSAERYRRDGYLRRTLRNQTCLLAYGLGMSPTRIAQRYASPPHYEKQ